MAGQRLTVLCSAIAPIGLPRTAAPSGMSHARSLFLRRQWGRFLTPAYDHSLLTKWLGFGFRIELFDQDPQGFCNRPGLREATPCPVRRFRVKNLRDLAETGVMEVALQPIEKRPRLSVLCRVVALDLPPGYDKPSQQKRPDCPLMIGSVSLRDRAFVPRAIPVVLWRESPQPHRREQMVLHDPEDLLSLFLGHLVVAEGDRVDLIGTNRRIVALWSAITS